MVTPDVPGASKTERLLGLAIGAELDVSDPIVQLRRATAD